MKNLVFLFSLLVAMTFVSCSKEDPRPASGSQITDNNFAWTFPVTIASTNASLTLNGNTIQLTNLLSATNQDKAKFLTALELNYNASKITISGLSAGQVIQNVTVQTSDKTVTSLNLGTITGTGSPVIYADNTTITFLNNVCTSLFKNKSIALNVTVSTGEQTISGVSIVISPTATLRW